MVGRAERHRFHGQRCVDHTVDAVDQVRVGQALVELDGRAGSPGQADGHGPGRLRQFGARTDMIHQPQHVRLGRRHDVPGEEELLAPVGPEEEGPQDGATVAGHQTGLDVGVGDTSLLGHVDDVAEERHRRSEPDGVAVDGRDHGLRNGDLRTHHVGRADHQVRKAVLVPGVEVVLHPAEISAGAEGLVPRAGQHHHAHGPVRTDPPEQRGDFGVHLRRDGVAALRSIEGHPQDPFVAQLRGEVREAVEV